MTHDPGWLIHRYDSVASTMDVASQLARFGARERTVVVSTEQTAGRGRGGRSWQAAAGSAVFATLILRPPVAAHRLSTLPLIAGVAVAEAIERIAGCAVWLKWPNDVWLGDGGAAKVAGILVTSSLRGDTVDHALVGIGINVLERARAAAGCDKPSRRPRSHRDSGRGASCLLERFGEAYAAFVAADGRPSLDGWLARAALLGEVVTIEDAGPLTYRNVRRGRRRRRSADRSRDTRFARSSPVTWCVDRAPPISLTSHRCARSVFPAAVARRPCPGGWNTRSIAIQTVRENGKRVTGNAIASATAMTSCQISWEVPQIRLEDQDDGQSQSEEFGNDQVQGIGAKKVTLFPLEPNAAPGAPLAQRK